MSQGQQVVRRIRNHIIAPWFFKLRREYPTVTIDPPIGKIPEGVTVYWDSAIERNVARSTEYGYIGDGIQITEEGILIARMQFGGLGPDDVEGTEAALQFPSQVFKIREEHYAVLLHRSFLSAHAARRYAGHQEDQIAGSAWVETAEPAWIDVVTQVIQKHHARVS